MLAALTIFHVALSLIGIIAGLVFVAGLMSSKRRDGWTSVFLWTTVATNVTGFFFPIHGLTPGLVLAVLSLIALTVAIRAWSSVRAYNSSGTSFVIASTIALYFNVFVLIAQSFAKIPALKELAPTQSDPPFAIAQSIVLVIFITLGVMATQRVRRLPLAA
jgi:hypothetical protein